MLFRSRSSPLYHQFLTSDQFAAQFGPSDETVSRVTQELQAQGLNVTRFSPTLLHVSGTPTAVQNAFGVELHMYEAPAGKSLTPAVEHYMAPVATNAPAVSLEGMQAVLGLDTRARYQSHIHKVPHAIKQPATSQAAVATADPPGEWTVVDFAQYYNAAPLYKHGITGAGKTIGIVTLASFTPTDAYAYWSAVGLTVAQNRISEVQIDGGSGAPSDASGSDETTLDVEQSGGVAPGAKIIVYEAPNTDQGFIDAFAKAIQSNQADAISTSWGEWEWFDETTNVKNPLTGRTVNVLQAQNALFAQAALQGQSMSASAGDDGAYDVNDANVAPVPIFSKVLSVDSPASSPYITAAGGTTLPGPQTFIINASGALFTVNVPTEQAWGWDYLNGLCQAVGAPDPVSCGTFPGGGGGGISSYQSIPLWQLLARNIRTSPSGQTLTEFDVTPPETFVTLPAGFHGRNVPDISMNADPNTGYIIFYTSNVQGPIVLDFFGGTSFVAPQLAGMTALLDQTARGRIGLLTPSLYLLASTSLAYHGNSAVLRDITAGDNWFFNAGAGYDQASGVGVPNIANMAALISWF